MSVYLGKKRTTTNKKKQTRNSIYINIGGHPRGENERKTNSKPLFVTLLPGEATFYADISFNNKKKTKAKICIITIENRNKIGARENLNEIILGGKEYCSKLNDENARALL